MNKQYRVVFNHQRNAFVVVSEQAKTQGKAQVSNVGKTTMQAVLSAATILTASLSTTPVLADNWTVTGDKAYNNTNNTTLSFWDFDNEDHACGEMSHCYLSFRPGKAPKYEGVAGFYDAQGATEAVQIITGTHPNTPNWYQKEGNATQLYNMKKSFDLIRETNKLREENGLTPFKVSHKLMAIAQLHHKNWYSEEETFDDEQRHSLSSGYVAPYAQQHIQHWYEKGKKGFWEETNDGFTPYQKCEFDNRYYCAFVSGLKGIPDEYAHLTATGAGYLPDTGVDTNHRPYWITTYANSANDAISFEEYEKLFDAYYATNGQTFYNENQTVTAYDVELTRLFGGYATEGKNATGNTVNLSGKSSSPNNSYGADIYGGYAVKGNANGNTVNVSNNAVASDIYAGFTSDGDANNNVVNVYGGEISKIIAGATLNNGNATYNTVNIYAGDIGHITGSYSHYKTGIQTHNIVNIYGGKVGDVAAGAAGEVRDSAVNYFDGQVKYEIRGAKTG
ncbi:MAG: hypothetical protein IJ780_05615, partial [Neisseriaceae bacterium]|nr:hypothetical protein [Neisseriaceae bacterium]